MLHGRGFPGHIENQDGFATTATLLQLGIFQGINIQCSITLKMA